MSDEEKSSGFFESLGRCISKLSLKIKLVFGAIFGFLGMILFFRFKNQRNIKEMLEYELKKVRSEIEIEKAKEAVSINDDMISKLEEKETAIRDKIEEINKSDSPEDVSVEDLDKFFDERGF